MFPAPPGTWESIRIVSASMFYTPPRIAASQPRK